MWSNDNRGRYDRSKLRYPSDLTDDEWSLIAPLIEPAREGRGEAHSECARSGLVSRASPVHTAARNCMGDEGRPFEVGDQVLISSHRKLLSSKATVVNVAEKSEPDSGRHD